MMKNYGKNFLKILIALSWSWKDDLNGIDSDCSFYQKLIYFKQER